MNDLTQNLENTVRKEAVRYACSHKMFDDDGSMLDVNRAVLLTHRESGDVTVMGKARFLAMVRKIIDKAKASGAEYNPDGWKDVFEVWDGKTGEVL